MRTRRGHLLHILYHVLPKSFYVIVEIFRGAQPLVLCIRQLVLTLEQYKFLFKYLNICYRKVFVYFANSLRCHNTFTSPFLFSLADAPYKIYRECYTYASGIRATIIPPSPTPTLFLREYFHDKKHT